MTVQPLQRGLTQLCLTCGLDHAFEGLKQRFDDDAEDPELPVLQRPHLDVLVELLLHVVAPLPRHWDSRGWKLLLTQTDGVFELLDLLLQFAHILLHLLPLLLQFTNVVHSLLQSHRVTDIGLRLERWDQATEGFEAIVDVAASLLFGRDVRGPPALVLFILH